MVRKILSIGVVVSVAALAYFAAKKIDAETISELRDKLSGVEVSKVRESVAEQKEEVEEKISQLATKIADAAKEILEKGSELAVEKKQALLELIEDAKKGIQEEKERLKEMRSRLDSVQDNEVI